MKALTEETRPGRCLHKTGPSYWPLRGTSLSLVCPSSRSSYKDTDQFKSQASTTFEQVTDVFNLRCILRAINANRDLAGGGAQFLVQAAVSADPHVVLGDPHLSIKSTNSV